MLVLLSPAKNLKFDPPAEELAENLSWTQPELFSDAKKLVKVARTLSPAGLQGLMHINEKLAQLNYERFKSFKLRQDAQTASTKAAALAFNGEVYLGLDANTLSSEELNWAQDHLRILSGLYGILRPLDLVQPYRLEMGSKLKNEVGPNLYSFWGDKITKRLNKALKESGNDVVINLASNEYFSAVQKDKLKGRIITADFKEVKEGVAKSLMVYVKRARGLMARYIIRNRIMNPEDLANFSEDGYVLNQMLSTPDKLIFTRERAKKAA